MWLLWTAVSLATPIEFVHQGRLLDADGAPQNGALDMQVVLTGSEGPVHTESFDDVAVTDGFYAITLGSGVTLDSEVFLDPPLTLTLTVGNTTLPPSPFVSVGHAGAADVTDRVQVVDGPLAAPCAQGQIRWDRSVSALRVCVDGAWTASEGVSRTLVSDGTTRRWSDGTVAASCAEYRQPPGGYAYAGATGAGRYQVDPGDGEVAAYCAMDDGNYTLLAGSTVDGLRSAIDTSCPTGFAPFVVSSAERVEAVEAYVQWSRASTWWWANSYAGPDNSCASQDLLVGYLTGTTWNNPGFDIATVMPNLTLTNNCNQNAFDPVPLHVDDGFRNRGCATCLYNGTERSEPGRVVCGLVD